MDRNRNQREQRSRRPAAALRLSANRHGNQRQGQTSNRKCKPAVKFHAGLAPARAVIVIQFANRAFGIVELSRLSECQAAELNRPVALSKRRYRVVVGIYAREFMSSAALQMQL